LARYKALAEAVAEYVREREGRQLALLDVGVGSGRSMRYIEGENVADLIDFHGFDLKQARLKSVYAPQRWRLFQGDIQRGTPFESGYFDIVLCEQVLEHLTHPAAVMNEIARVLRPNGLLILGVPIFPWGVSRLRALMVRLSAKWLGITRSHLLSFDRPYIRRLIGEHDRFTIRRSYGVRILSGGLLSPLEDFLWWYRFNRWAGRVVPGLCTEIQIVATRNRAP
jgi:SAM-dependent methyltransferase